MEHRLITGGYEYLPFARSCITKLKKLGLPYADQSYEVGGVSIKVRIEPGHEYIRIEGDQKWYSIFPRSLKKPGGVTRVTNEEGFEITVTPYAMARPDNKSKLHKHYQTGRFDWVSFDGLAKDGSPKYGKRLITFDGDTLGRYPVAFDSGFYVSWINLQNIVINGKLAVFSSPVSGIAIKDVLLDDGTKEAYVVYASVLHKVDLTSVIGFYKVPLKDVFTEGHADTQMGDILDIPGLVRQPIYFDGSGTKFVSFFTTYLGAGVTTTHILSGEVDTTATTAPSTFSVFDTGQVNEYSHIELGAGTENSYSHVTTSNGWFSKLIGVDLTLAGEKVELTYKEGSWSRLTAYSGGFLAGREDTYRNGKEYMLGAKSLGFHGTGYYLFGTYGNYDADYEKATNLGFVFGLYDVDLRYSAAVWIEQEYGSSWTAYFINPERSFASTEGDGLKLRAVFGSDTKAKEIRPHGSATVDPMLLQANYESKMIASREGGSYMVCANVPEALNTGRLGYAAAFAGVDLTPLAFGRTGKKLIDADLGKFGFDASESGIRYTPITLIYSDGSLKAP